MGFGYVLGGVAQGLQAQDELAMKQTATDAATARANAQIGIALKGLEVKQQTLADTQSRNLQTQVNKHIADVTKLVTEIIKNSPTAPRDKLMNSIAPLMDDIDAWGSRLGQDTSKLRAGLVSLAQQPVTNNPKVGQTVEGIKAKMARGEPVTAGEQKLYNDSLHAQSTEDIVNQAVADAQAKAKAAGATGAPATGGVPAPTATAPAAAPAPAAAAATPSAQAATGGHPPIPPSIANWPNLSWSPSTQKFYSSDGRAANQQGVPVTP